jgi:osmoprotectant transport system permease protein
MSFANDVVDWFTTSAHWHGTAGIPHRLEEHVVMSAAATVAACVIALPIGIALGHRHRSRAAATVAINVANIGRALPSYGILVLFAVAFGLSGWPGFGARPAFVALFLLAIPPMLTNAYIGVRDVDADTRDAARGMGMTGMQVLRRVELPLAMPLVLAGVRTSAVQVVATATLAALTGWGGLGRYIVDGFSQFDNPQIFAGALLVAVLAVATEAGLGLVQRLLVPDRLRRSGPSGEPDAMVSAGQVPVPPMV